MLEALGKDHIRTARAYGLGERLIVSRLALRNALVPVLTVIGLTLAYLLTGTFFVEIVFNWPGLGTFAVKSILATDYPAIMGITLFGAAAYVLINLAVDLAAGLGRPAHPADLMAVTSRQLLPPCPSGPASAPCGPGHCAMTRWRCSAWSSSCVVVAALLGPGSAPPPGDGAGVIDVASACCRRAASTPSAPTGSAATCSAASSWAPGRRWQVSLHRGRPGDRRSECRWVPSPATAAAASTA